MAIYGQAEVQCWFRSAVSSSVQPGSSDELIEKITQLHLEQSGMLRSAGPGRQYIEVSCRRKWRCCSPTTCLEIDSSVIRTVHGEIMVKKDEILLSHGFVASDKARGSKELPWGKQVDDFVKALNGLALGFQSQLKEKIGLDSYIKFNGDEKYYKPINPAIARNLFDSVTKNLNSRMPGRSEIDKTIKGVHPLADLRQARKQFHGGISRQYFQYPFPIN